MKVMYFISLIFALILLKTRRIDEETNLQRTRGVVQILETESVGFRGIFKEFFKKSWAIAEMWVTTPRSVYNSLNIFQHAIG